VRLTVTGAARTELGERLAGFVYGTIVVLSVIVAGARDYGHEPGHIASLVALTCVVFWLAHVYAHALGDTLAHGERIDGKELRKIARREASIIEAAVPPVIALLLGTTGLLREQTALWLAFVLALVVLGAQGVVYARVERLAWLGTVSVVAANVALGLVLVALKLLLTH
jgi:archaellum biogenesis protein FlaJ (TadC family)